MKKKNRERGNSQLRKGILWLGTVFTAVKIMVVIAILSGCTKDVLDYYSSPDSLIDTGIDEVYPANAADNVEVNPVIGVTFNSTASPSEIAASSLSVKNGNASVPGTVTVSGKSALFSYAGDLKPMTEYTATIRTSHGSGSSQDKQVEYTWKFKTGKNRKDNSLAVVSVSPENKNTDVALASQISITVDKEVQSWMKGFISVKVNGDSKTVNGDLLFSGNTITFDPKSDLVPNTLYSCTFSYKMVGNGNSNSHDDEEEDEVGENSITSQTTIRFTWTFTTSGSGTPADNTDNVGPSIISVVPAANAASVSPSAVISVNFSEKLDPSTVTVSTFTLKQGSNNVAVTVSYSGTTATLTPSANLAAGTVYTAGVSTGVKDLAGNALSSIFTWSFTTASAADIVAPTVVSVVPAANAVSVATDSKIVVTFSEAMNAATITASNFILKQGSTSVPGTVSYSGNVATLTPSSVLAGGVMYTATISTGVKDAAGNQLAKDYTWSFSTVSASTGMSFSSDVIPVLNQCNNCHTHPWTTSSVASTYYTNLVNGGYINPANPTSSLIYTKISGGHASSISSTDRNKILTWIKEGAKNN